MATGSDVLLEHLLFQVALSGDIGFTITGLSSAFIEFNNNNNAVERDGSKDEDNGDDQDLLFSLKPPGASLDAKTQASDPQHLEKLWTWLTDHPDITVSDAASTMEDPYGKFVDTSASNPLAPVFAAHAKERLYTTEHRVWHALTDHDVDWKRIPKLEFHCLQVIAAAGREGVLQPDVTRITGQDKRSVPKRTDALAVKGYITKEMCLGGGIKTSLLRLKKLVLEPSTTFYTIQAKAGKGEGATRRMINYEQWFSEVMTTLKKHDGLIAYEDLRKEIGIHGSRWETRALHRCIKRLEKAGCVQRLRARLEGARPRQAKKQQEGATPAYEHRYEINPDAPTEKVDAEKTEHDPENVFWVRCIKLMREPVEKDLEAFTSTIRVGKAGKAVEDQESDAEADADEDDDYVEIDAAALDGLGKMTEITRRVPPQWRPDMHHTQFFFQIIDNAGTKGLSTMDLANFGLGPFWRRPLDEIMGRLSDVWTVSQPLHLRHLAIVRDTSQMHRISHYVFRSYHNFQKMVANGDANWHAIDVQEAEIQRKPDLDDWGFPKVKPSTMVGHDGSHNLAACKSVLVKSKAKPKRPLWEKKALGTTDSPSSSKTPKTPRKRNKPAEIPLSTAQPVKSVEDKEVATPATAQQTTIKKKTSKVMFKMNPKRVEAELNEWKIRSHKLAVSKAKAELGLNAKKDTTKPRKRGRPSKSKEVTSETPVQSSTADTESVPPSLPDEAVLQASGGAPNGTPSLSDEQSLQKSAQQLSEDAIPTEKTTVNPELNKRVAELESEILSLTKPGVYINPPGSGQAKNNVVQAKGRPSRYLIAVFKSDRLKSLPWFTEENFNSLPSSQAGTPEPTSAISQPGTPASESSTNDIEAPPSADASKWTAVNSGAPDTASSAKTIGLKDEIVIRKGRRIQVQRQGKRKAYEPLRQKVAKKLAVEQSADDGKWRPLAELEDAYNARAMESPPNTPSVLRRAVPVPEASTSPVSQLSLDAPPSVAGVSDISPEAHTAAELLLQQADSVPSEPDEASEHATEERQASTGAVNDDLEMVDADNAENIVQESPAASTPVKAAGREQMASISPLIESDKVQPPHVTDSQRILEPFFRRASKRPDAPVPVQEIDEAGSPSTPAPYNPFAKIEVKSAATAARFASRAKAPSKVGVGRSGGIVSYNRNRVILEIVRRNDGMFGGDRELYYPFVTAWEREFQRRPDRHTLDRVLAGLIEEGRLKRERFSFSTSEGKIFTKTLVMEPHIDPESPEATALKQKIIECHPMTYVPEGIEVLPELRLRIENDLRGGKGIPDVHNPNSSFIYDPTAVVTRIQGPQKVELGMTEARMKKGVTARRHRREEEERRQQRYFEAQMEETIDNAVAALTTDFQLDSYEHDPTRAVVDRGPRGRGRLAKLQRWGAEDQIVPRRALGLLTTTGRDAQLEAEQNSRDAVAAADFGVLKPQLIPTVPQREVPTAPRVRFELPKEPSLVQMLHQKQAGTFSVIDALSMTAPYQRFHRQSGTYSTDPVVITTSSQQSQYGFVGQQMQIPRSLADIFKQAGEEATLLELPTEAPHVGYEVPRFAAVGVTRLPRLHSARPRPAPRPQPEYKSYGAKAVLPRSSRTGIFSMSEKEEQRLIYAVVVVKTLTGGLEQIVNWGLVHQVFHYKFDPNYCRHRWVFLRPKLGGTADKLQVEFQKLFLEAYESGEVPGIDFVEPEKYDWLGIVEWAERRLAQTNPLNGLPELPKSRQTLDKRFDVRHATEVYNIPREDFWVANVTHLRREELANSWTFARPLAGTAELAQDDDELMLALSWVRANVITPDPVYDSNRAHEKLIKIEEQLPQALDHLLGAKIIRMENKGRQIPGRNYDISDSVLTMFKRQWDVRYLKKTAAAKKTIDEAFAKDGKLAISYQASDAEMTAMTNMVAAGRAKVVPLLPETNHTMGAPYPRLTKWGFTEGNYKTVHMDKSRLNFLLELHPTSTYVHGIPIAPIPGPPLSKQFPGELGPRLPLWTDIHGNLIKVYWEMTVMATLWLLAFRPGLKIDEISKGAYKGKLWNWELEMFLSWAENAGLAKKLEFGGDNGPEADGWVVSEWWWLAFATE
ncbi:hypothetical protein M436DRAFT_42522 [Aureobasidium namibiae CBS 147.97]|uniref:Uncharacterized protein n=1 Tax=Aureobasidium namibiae CBS 147.97 TaxID=1043004 RepID=A0A074WYG8_9PEZI|nr:uncharacterized protein M436DRAFT_42522 [Aureobasidium namibiae CBS 147.97]KEQ74812.1 hypothetical protein M436DRAFT_42522 [Aureobasidium namibiae CBS 147.97]